MEAQPAPQKKLDSKAIVIAAVVVLILIGAGAAAYFSSQSTETNTNLATANQASANLANLNTNAAPTDSTYIHDDFTVLQPAGWVQVTLPSTLAAFQIVSEDHPLGSAAEKINFRSYSAVSFDNTQGKTLEAINLAAIDSIKSALSSANVFSSADETINSLAAKLSVLELNQQDVDYTVLLVIYLAGDKYYTMSFNTTTEKWLEYKNMFYGIARSFKLKD